MNGARDQRLGIVAFLGVAALILAALVLFSRYPSLFHSGREFRSVFRSVAGLNVGDEVRYGGLLIGTVTALDLDEKDPTTIVVTYRVKRKTPVRADTRATITQVGFLGTPYLNLTPGAADSPPLAPGSTVPSSDQMNFQDALTRLAVFFERADTLLSSAERLAKSSPLERVDRTLTQVEHLVGNASTSSERVFAQLESASEKLGSVLNRTDRLISALDTTVRAAKPEFATTQREALGTLREMRTLIADVREALNEGGGTAVLVRNLAETADNLARLTARLERDPSSVLKKRDAPKKTVGPTVRD